MDLSKRFFSVMFLIFIGFFCLMNLIGSSYVAKVKQQRFEELLLEKNTYDALDKVLSLSPEQRYNFAYERIYDYDDEWVAICLKGIISVKPNHGIPELQLNDDFIYLACIESLSKYKSGFLEVGFKDNLLARYAKQIIEDKSLAMYHNKILEKLCKDRPENDDFGIFARYELIKRVSNLSPSVDILNAEKFDLSKEDQILVGLFCEKISVKFFRDTLLVEKYGLRDTFSTDKKICAFFVGRDIIITSSGLSANTFAWIMSECSSDPKRKAMLESFQKDPHGEYLKIINAEKSSQAEIEGAF